MIKKILVICDNFLPPNVKVAGVKNLYLLQRHLSAKGFIIHLVVFVHNHTVSNWQDWRKSEEAKYNIRFHVFNVPFKRIYFLHLFITRTLSFFIVLFLQISNRFDLIHEYSSAPFLVNRTYLLGLLTGAKTVHTLCTMNKTLSGSVKLLFRSTNRLICSAKTLKNSLEERLKARIDFIPTPIDEIFFCNSNIDLKRGLSIKTKKAVIFSGILDARKGIATFLEAVPCIMENNADTGIVILTAPGLNTDNACRENRKKALALVRKYAERAVFIEEEVDVPLLFSGIDVQVYPPLTMHGTLGSPAILIEGMAMGKAIVASRLPEIAEIIKDGENGLLFTAGDDQELAQAVNKLLKEPDLRFRFGERAKADSQKYRLSVVGEQISNLYNEVLFN